MPFAQRSIIISQRDRNTVVFTPDRVGAQEGQPLGVNPGDLITWNNRTNYELELEVVKITISGVAKPVQQLFQGIRLQPGAPSDPIFNVTQDDGTIITYRCKNPTQQHHEIWVGNASRPKPKGGGGRPKGGGARPKGGRPRPKGGGPRPK